MIVKIDFVETVNYNACVSMDDHPKVFDDRPDDYIIPFRSEVNHFADMTEDELSNNRGMMDERFIFFN